MYDDQEWKQFLKSGSLTNTVVVRKSASLFPSNLV